MIPGSSDAASSSRPETQGSAGGFTLPHPSDPLHVRFADPVFGRAANRIESILTRRLFEDHIDGYLIEAANELAAAAREEFAAPTMLEALKEALPKLAHRASCHVVRPAAEWAEHGSASFANCDCTIKVVRAAIALAEQEG